VKIFFVSNGFDGIFPFSQKNCLQNYFTIVPSSARLHLARSLWRLTCVGVDEIEQISRGLRIPPEYLVMAALQDLNYPVATYAEGGAVYPGW
jgi:hypothetical protein